MKRRAWIVAGAATALAAAGAGVAIRAWREQRLDDATAGLWGLRFARPQGGELVMAPLRGRPLLLNFWATWCPPCIKEMPELDRFEREFGPRGWQVVGLAVDGPTPVREYLAKAPVRYPIGLAGFEGTELSQRLGNERGGLPFSVVFGSDGRIAARKLGETHYADLVRWTESVR